MPFVKGQVANPLGPFKAREQRMLRDLQSLTPKAITALGRALEEGTISEQITAAKEVLDRNLGKATRKIDVAVTHSHELHLQALKNLAERVKQAAPALPPGPVIDAEVVEERVEEDEAVSLALEPSQRPRG